MDMKVITDTNIWYSIGNKEINLEGLDCKLFIPISVLFELITSPNLWISEETFRVCQNAIIALLNNRHDLEFISRNPLECLISKVSSFSETDSEISTYWSNLEFISERKFSDMKNIPFPDLRVLPKTTTDYFNSQSRKYKKKIKEYGKNNFNKESTIRAILSLLNSLVKQYSNKNEILLERELEESDSYLFINVFNVTLRELSKSNLEIENNDWIDLFNLVYVEDDMRYWTKEKRWIKFITYIQVTNATF